MAILRRASKNEAKVELVADNPVTDVGVALTSFYDSL
jgi:hypothetical protein